MKNEPIVVYRGIAIYDERGYYWFYINNFRFVAESLDDAERIIDGYENREGVDE